MQLYYDLHIHSALSPCGDADMTPNNIVHMAMLKGLHLIAVTDHNAAANLPAVKRIADACGVLLLPGLEINTAEEVHLLAYFAEVAQAVEFGEYIYAALPDVANRPDIFGEQHIMDEDDQVTGQLDKLLINACTLSIDQLVGEIRAAGGLPVPAHVNRASNSILANLGYIAPDYGFSAIEVAKSMPLAGVDVERYRLLYSSDAHYIIDIAEPEQSLHIEGECTPAAVLKKLAEMY